MNNEHLRKHWKIVEVQLKQASEFLYESERFSVEERDLEDYENYIDNNDFELALDELSYLAKEYGCKSGFWRRLQKPALQMGLKEKVEEYEELFHKALASKSV